VLLDNKNIVDTETNKSNKVNIKSFMKNQIQMQLNIVEKENALLRAQDLENQMNLKNMQFTSLSEELEAYKRQVAQ